MWVFFTHWGLVCYLLFPFPSAHVLQGSRGGQRDRARAAGTAEAKGRGQQPALGWDGFALSRVWGGKEGKSTSVFIDIKIQR